MDYIINDGLLGDAFPYNLFTGAERVAATPTPRLKLLQFLSQQALIELVASASSGYSPYKRILTSSYDQPLHRR